MKSTDKEAKPISKTEAIQTIKQMPAMHAEATGYGKEIKAWRHGMIEGAYFTDDPQDAVDTARRMEAGNN